MMLQKQDSMTSASLVKRKTEVEVRRKGISSLEAPDLANVTWASSSLISGSTNLMWPQLQVWAQIHL